MTDPHATGSRAANAGQRQWVTFALLGREIDAQDAAARLSILQHADEYDVDAPDVRGDGFDYDRARDELEALRA
jgi:hypothetical protein